ncbi:hypothetical protein AVEN_272431-1 [Araneus ventricosus]|uniref:Uncharacterized protein n=1 Tax=Araneus ventricosus TaxID=182803 RepID=A0A4Y2V268_ARAVE|nr:hypothetical protein AVEN_272431-1 [Araneus ventricosus]
MPTYKPELLHHRTWSQGVQRLTVETNLSCRIKPSLNRVRRSGLKNFKAGNSKMVRMVRSSSFSYCPTWVVLSNDSTRRDKSFAFVMESSLNRVRDRVLKIFKAVELKMVEWFEKYSTDYTCRSKFRVDILVVPDIGLKSPESKASRINRKVLLFSSHVGRKVSNDSYSSRPEPCYKICLTA